MKQFDKERLPYLAAFLSDLGRIQTCNLLSRNQVHYSVMLRGHFVVANIIAFFKIGYNFIDDFQNLDQKKSIHLMDAFTVN